MSKNRMITHAPPTRDERRAYVDFYRKAGFKIFRVVLSAPRSVREATIAAGDALEARTSVLREWYGLGVFWDAEDGRGRVVQQRLVKRRGKERFVEKPLTPWGKISVKEVRS